MCIEYLLVKIHPPLCFWFQGGDSRFDSRERVKYTRDQLLELKEVSRIKPGLV